MGNMGRFSSFRRYNIDNTLNNKKENIPIISKTEEEIDIKKNVKEDEETLIFKDFSNNFDIKNIEEKQEINSNLQNLPEEDYNKKLNKNEFNKIETDLEIIESDPEPEIVQNNLKSIKIKNIHKLSHIYKPIEKKNVDIFSFKPIFEENEKFSKLKMNVEEIGLIDKTFYIAVTPSNKTIIMDGNKRIAIIQKLLNENKIEESLFEGINWIFYYNLPEYLCNIYSYCIKQFDTPLGVYDKARFINDFIDSFPESDKKNAEDKAKEIFGIKERMLSYYIELKNVSSLIKDNVGVNSKKILIINKILTKLNLKEEEKAAKILELNKLPYEILVKELKFLSSPTDFIIKENVSENKIFLEMNLKNSIKFSLLEKNAIKQRLHEIVFFVNSLKTGQINSEEMNYNISQIKQKADIMIQSKKYFFKSDIGIDFIPDEDLKELGYSKIKVSTIEGAEIEAWSKGIDNYIEEHDAKLLVYMEQFVYSENSFIRDIVKKETPIMYHDIYVKMPTFNHNNPEYAFLKLIDKRNNKEFSDFTYEKIIPDLFYSMNEDKNETFYFYEHEYSSKKNREIKVPNSDNISIGYIKYFRMKFFNYIKLFVFLFFKKNFNSFANTKEKTHYYLYNFKFNIVLIYNSNRYNEKDINAIKEYLKRLKNDLSINYSGLFSEVIKRINFSIELF